MHFALIEIYMIGFQCRFLPWHIFIRWINSHIRLHLFAMLMVRIWKFNCWRMP